MSETSEKKDENLEKYKTTWEFVFYFAFRLYLLGIEWKRNFRKSQHDFPAFNENISTCAVDDLLTILTNYDCRFLDEDVLVAGTGILIGTIEEDEEFAFSDKLLNLAILGIVPMTEK